MDAKKHCKHQLGDQSLAHGTMSPFERATRICFVKNSDPSVIFAWVGCILCQHAGVSDSRILGPLSPNIATARMWLVCQYSMDCNLELWVFQFLVLGMDCKISFNRSFWSANLACFMCICVLYNVYKICTWLCTLYECVRKNYRLQVSWNGVGVRWFQMLLEDPECTWILQSMPCQ